MSLPSSSYQFPIFISSTDYNLLDLRAELARFLEGLGYRPILSSAEGFPDSSPLQPWESCLDVLKTTFVMILVIDNRYGHRLKWEHFKEIIGDREVAPTHAEYLFAQKTGMRKMVFIRRGMMSYYQLYREAQKDAQKEGANVEDVMAAFKKLLPKHLGDFEVMEFIHEVKTTNPVPWIKEFDNVIDIKKEVQVKLLNELADVYMYKQNHAESVVRAFKKLIENVSPEKQTEIFMEIGATKEMITVNQSLKVQKDELEKETESLKAQLIKPTNQPKEQKAIQVKLKNANSKLFKVNEQLDALNLATANLLTGSNFLNLSLDPAVGSGNMAIRLGDINSKLMTSVDLSKEIAKTYKHIYPTSSAVYTDELMAQINKTVQNPLGQITSATSNSDPIFVGAKTKADPSKYNKSTEEKLASSSGTGGKKNIEKSVEKKSSTKQSKKPKK